MRRNMCLTFLINANVFVHQSTTNSIDRRNKLWLTLFKTRFCTIDFRRKYLYFVNRSARKQKLSTSSYKQIFFHNTGRVHVLRRVYRRVLLCERMKNVYRSNGNSRVRISLIVKF